MGVSASSIRTHRRPAVNAAGPAQQDEHRPARVSTEGPGQPPAGRERAGQGTRARLFAAMGRLAAHDKAKVPEMQTVDVKRRPGMKAPDLTKASNAVIAHKALMASFEMTDEASQALCANIETMQAIERHGDKRLLKAAGREFRRTHKDLISPSDFSAVKVLGPLKDYIRQTMAERESRPPVPRKPDETTAGGKGRPSFRGIDEQRFERFVESLLATEREQSEPDPAADEPEQSDKHAGDRGHAAEAANFQLQYVPAPPAQNMAPLSLGAYQRVRNIGGGDCLFHALAGRNLSYQEVVELRGRVADIRREMQPGEEAWNAQRLVAGLTQTPGIGSFGQELMTGRHSISNQLLADFQAIPGMYAGDDELEQWSRLPGNQSKKIVVVHGNGEALEAYTNGTRTRIGRTEFHQEAAQADLVLHRRGAHWERIMPPQQAAFDATGNALVPSTELFVHPRHGSIDIFRHAKPNGIDKIEFTLHLSPNAGAPIQHQQTMFVQRAADGARSWLKYSASGLDGKLRSAGGPVFLLRAAAAAAEALGLELVVVDATASKSTQTLCHSLGMTSGKPAGEYKLNPATMKHNADHRITERGWSASVAAGSSAAGARK